jgi:hypothetical protein
MPGTVSSFVHLDAHALDCSVPYFEMAVLGAFERNSILIGPDREADDVKPPIIRSC